MLARLILRNQRVFSLVGIVCRQTRRTIHLSTIKQTESKPNKRLPMTATEMTELVFKRLHIHEQRGLVKALVIGSGIVVISTVLFLYVFRTPLKNQTVAQVADVAKSSLEQGNCRID